MKRALIALVAALAVMAGACSDGSDASDQAVGSGGGEEASAEFNDADVAFVQGMIPHHEQAVVMSELAADNAGSDEVKDLAERIEAAQGPEIEQMMSFLEDWDVASDAGDEGDMDGMDHGGMSGMMTDDQMAELETATGAEFDRLFLEMMTEHHRGAVEMAETELSDGENAEAQALAQEIIDTQEAEIEEMAGLLQDLA